MYYCDAKQNFQRMIFWKSFKYAGLQQPVSHLLD